MPGRPKMKHARVRELATELQSLIANFDEAMPDQYKKDAQPWRNGLQPNDYLREAWREAGYVLNESRDTLLQLLVLLAEKAGVRGPYDPDPATVTLEDLIHIDDRTVSFARWCRDFNIDPEVARKRALAGECWEGAIMDSVEEGAAGATVAEV